MKSIAVVGLGFGDEGKGALVDALVRKHDAPLVVRFSGGCQAGHNVELPDGTRHCFSQFGAGTLAGAATYLGPDMIIDIPAMRNEAAALRAITGTEPFAKLTVSPRCLIATSVHRVYNRVWNEATKHGSCGMGVGAAREYWLEHGMDAPVAGDTSSPRILMDKLRLLKSRLLERASRLSSFNEKLHHNLKILETLSPVLEARSLRDHVVRSDIWIDYHDTFGGPDFPYHSAKTVIFEGSQGILLDQYAGFHPHTTWSDLTTQPAREILSAWGCSDNITTIGVTRAYHTRHGNGPFPTANKGFFPGFDKGNEPSYQGEIRAGVLDMNLLRYAVNAVQPDYLAVSCLDHIGDRPEVCRGYQYGGYHRGYSTLPEHPFWSPQQQEKLTYLLSRVTPIIEPSTDLLKEIGALRPIIAESYGPTYEKRTWRDAAEGSP